MKLTILPILLVVVLLSSCSSAYKSSQTPDDVYYSPTKVITEETASTTREDERYQQSVSQSDERYLRMKAHNYNRWNALDDYAYWNDSRYDFSQCSPSRYNIWHGYGLAWNNFYYNSYYSYFNGWYGCGYSPVYYVIGYKNTNTIIGSNSGSYLSAYKNKTYNNTNYYAAKSASYQPSNGNSFGNLVRRVVTPSSSANSSYINTYDRAARTFTPNNNGASYTPSSNAGGHSGGYSSSGSSASGGRAVRQ